MTGPPLLTMPCRACGHDVPAGKFCGLCGARLTRDSGRGPDWLRVSDYAAAPSESVLQPSIVSSVFPHLPERSHGAFRAGLALMLTVLVVFALAGWQIPIIAVGTLGPLLIFGIYLFETGVVADLPRRIWVLTVVLGILVGAVWVWTTTNIFAQSYGMALGAQTPDIGMVLKGIVIPFGGVLVMQIPAALVVSIRPRHHREALDGFAVGVLGATTFAASATLLRLIPQFKSGVFTQAQPLLDLLIGTGILGVTMPLSVAAFGGVIGAGLWYGAGRRGVRRVRLFAVVALVLVFFAAAYTGVGLTDLFPLPLGLQFAKHAVMALVVLAAMRVALQLALLRERDDETAPESPILCPHCGHVVPDMTFCPACGVSAHASSRASREARRADRPQPVEQEAER